MAPGARAAARAETTARILTVARRHLAEQGAGALSMRAVAREVGIVSSAIHRYYATKDDLITAMVMQSYTRLDVALGAAPQDESATAPTGSDPAQRWRALARRLREWALGQPHEFQLIYGSPIPGYAAPPQTVPLAAAVAGHFLAVGATAPVPAYARLTLEPSMRQALPAALDSSGVAAVIGELAALVGTLGLELSGHFVGTVTSPQELFEALLDRQVATLGLA